MVFWKRSLAVKTTLKASSVVGLNVLGTTVKSFRDPGFTVMLLVVPLLLEAVSVIVGVSEAFTRVKPDFVRTPLVNVSLASEGLVGVAALGEFVAVQVQTTE